MDYLASSGVGVDVSSFGTGLASGIQGVFSDILGRNQIYAGVAVNGEVYDIGGAVEYINQTGRWNYGFGVSHIPYQFANYTVVPTTYTSGTTTIPAVDERYDIIRVFEDQVEFVYLLSFFKNTTDRVWYRCLNLLLPGRQV